MALSQFQETLADSAGLLVPVRPLQAGTMQAGDTVIGGYTVERELGGGGMSRVFLAHEERLGRDVVIKVLPAELAADVNVERFRREILLSAGLQHPHIVSVLSAGEVDGRPYLIMPYVDGESLRARLAREGRLRIVDAVSILRDVARALSYAHARGVVHRDIKPDNVLLASGTGGSAVVADFGVAKALDAARHTGTFPAQGTLTAVGSSLGTPAYMAPEQIAADPAADHRVDLYAFGCMAHEMLAGEGPFHGRAPHAMLAAHISEKPRSLIELRAGVPSVLARLVERCLAKDADARPQSAQEILAVLDDPSVLSGEFSTPPEITPAARPSLTRARVAALVVTLALVVLAVLTVSPVSPVSPLVTPRAVAMSTPGVAVLPMVYLGSDSAGIAANAIVAELTSAIARQPGVRAASGSTAVGIQQRIARGENVGGSVALYIEGVVQREDDRLRVDARLVNAADGFMVWADSYEGRTNEIFALRTEIGTAVLDALRAHLQLAEPAPRAGRTGSPTGDG